MRVEFVPVRWWQAATFICLNFEIVRGRDPMADRILTRPWTPSSLLEYAYQLDTFFRSNTHFVIINDYISPSPGEQAFIFTSLEACFQA